MTFYCTEKAKGRGCDAKETLGIPQCHYCYEYQRGYVEPTSPLPVKTNSETVIYTNWYNNNDDYWHWSRP